MDVAVVVNPANGKLTFARNAAGDFYFDERSVGPVFHTLFAVKGAYLWDGTVGTSVLSVTKDCRATGSRIVAACTDALQQVKAEQLVTDYLQPKASLLHEGAWQPELAWSTPTGPVKTALKI